MSWNGDNVDDAAAEIDGAGVFRPVCDAVKLFGGLNRGGDEGDGNGGIVERLQLRVAGSVVGVGVRVSNDEWNARSIVTQKPAVNGELQRWGDVSFARAGVKDECTVFAEEEIDEGLFVVGAAGLTEDVKVGVVFVDLPLRHLHALGSAGVPREWKGAGADVSSVRFGGLRVNYGKGKSEEKAKSDRFFSQRDLRTEWQALMVCGVWKFEEAQ
jgi:hypothetical protein